VNIQPIVEGHSEVEAVPILIRRLLGAAGVHELGVNRPIRRHRSELAKEAPLRKSVRLALNQENCRAILILFDGDDECPREWGPKLQGWAQGEAGEIPCVLVMAWREYEAWFLAAIESLRGVRGISRTANSHDDPESPRDAKGQLERRMIPNRSYSETIDQAPLTARFDLAQAHKHCRSFRRFVRAFGRLAEGVGVALDPWPPADWNAS